MNFMIYKGNDEAVNDFQVLGFVVGSVMGASEGDVVGEDVGSVEGMVVGEDVGSVLGRVVGSVDGTVAHNRPKMERMP